MGEKHLDFLSEFHRDVVLPCLGNVAGDLSHSCAAVSMQHHDWATNNATGAGGNQVQDDSREHCRNTSARILHAYHVQFLKYSRKFEKTPYFSGAVKN